MDTSSKLTPRGLAANLATVRPSYIDATCEDCDGFGHVILGSFNDPSAPEVRCDTCEGAGTVCEIEEDMAA